MKRRVAPVVLALLLLAGCAPSPKGDRAEFDAFVAQVDAARAENAVWTQEEKAVFETYTPDISNQADALTREELEALIEPHKATYLSKEEALEDIDLFFRLLKSAYGGYEYFGGDKTFLAAKEEVGAHFKRDKSYTSIVLQDALEQALKPFVRDGHFSIGKEPLLESRQNMYYVPDLYFTDPTGLDLDYVKPTIGPDGALTYCFAALSENGKDLPEQIGDRQSLNWVKAQRLTRGDSVAYRRSVKNGVTIMESRTLQAMEQWEDQLYQMAEDGAAYRELPCFIIDIRGNSGGADRFGDLWLRGYSGEEAQPKMAFGWKLSKTQLQWFGSEACKAQAGERFDMSQLPSEVGIWQKRLEDEKRIKNDNIVFVLTDERVASSAESVLYMLRTMDNVITVGGDTGGATNFGNIMELHLPNSGIKLRFGTSFSFFEGADNIEGVGILPDLWVNPADAQDAVLRLIGYYGLK